MLERASARETAGRVAAGAVAKALIRAIGIEVRSHVLQVGSVRATPPAWLSASDLDRAERPRCGASTPTPRRRWSPRSRRPSATATRWAASRRCGRTECRRGSAPTSRPASRLDGRIAAAILSIQSAKGVEIGDAIASASRRGSSVHDEIFHTDEKGWHRETDRAGGIEGGMTNGAEVVVRTIWKPLPTLMRPLRSAELGSHEPREAHVERSDVTVLPAAAVVAEAAVAWELARAAHEKFGGDAIGDFTAAHAAYVERIARA